MKLKEYLENINKLAAENPEALEFEVISSIDDEGNGYKRIYYSPSLGSYDDGEFFVSDAYRLEFNAICIN